MFMFVTLKQGKNINCLTANLLIYNSSIFKYMLQSIGSVTIVLQVVLKRVKFLIYLFILSIKR